MINFEALFKVSYGLYIVSAGVKSKANGYIANTVFQITAEPPRFAVCCHKNNYTAELINHFETFAVSVLSQNAPSEIISTFGYKSGREIKKMEGLDIKFGETGVPFVLNGCIAALEFEVIQTIDFDTHFMFIGKLLNAEMIDEKNDPMTYLYYRQIKKGLSPKNAPTYINSSKLVSNPKKTKLKTHKCVTCGFVYDDSTESQKFVDLPDDWTCPICGCEKEDFIEN